MAEPSGGLLAILADGEKGKSGSLKGEPGSAKARAVKAMHAAMQAGNWDDAADEFQTAYAACSLPAEDEPAEEFAEE